MTEQNIVLRRPKKIVVLDGTETEVIVKKSFRGVPVKNEESETVYRLLKTAVKNLQMVGA